MLALRRLPDSRNVTFLAVTQHYKVEHMGVENQLCLAGNGKAYMEGCLGDPHKNRCLLQFKLVPTHVCSSS